MRLLDKEYYRIDEITEYLRRHEDDLYYFAEKGDLSFYMKMNIPLYSSGIIGEELDLNIEGLELRGLFKLNKDQICAVNRNSKGEVFYSIDFRSQDRVNFYRKGELLHAQEVDMVLGKNGDLRGVNGCWSQNGPFSLHIYKRDMLIVADDMEKIKLLFNVDEVSRPLSAVSKGMPKAIKVAIQVYEEFWLNRPAHMNTAREEDIDRFIIERMGDETKYAKIERIRKIARPEYEKVGGAPRQDWKTYRGKSKENI